MDLDLRTTPRSFSPAPGLTLHDMGAIHLAPEEQLTFTTETGKRNDLIRKSWGYYLSNSINHTLRQQGFRTALVLSRLSPQPRLFLNLVEEEKLHEFLEYLQANQAEVLCWLDNWLPRGVEE